MLSVPDAMHNNKSMIFSCKIKKIVGFRILDKIYIIHYDKEDENKITNNLFLFKCLNSPSLRNSFYVYNTVTRYGSKPDTMVIKLNFKNWMNFNEVKFESDFANLEIIKLNIPPPPSNTRFSIKTFKLLFYNIIELEDFSNIWLIKTLNLKYYFKRLLLTDNVNNELDNLKKNIANSTKNIIIDKNINIELLTFYNSILSTRSLYNITNTYVYTHSTLKKFNKLNLFLNKNLKSKNYIDNYYINNQEIIDNNILMLFNLLKTYYSDIINTAIERSKKQVLITSSNKIVDIESITPDNLFIYFNMAFDKLTNNSIELKELNNLIKKDSIVNHIDNKNLAINLFKTQFKKVTSFRFCDAGTTRKLYVELFKFNLWEIHLKNFLILLHIIDKDNDIFYNIVDRIEQNLLKMKILE